MKTVTYVDRKFYPYGEKIKIKVVIQKEEKGITTFRREGCKFNQQMKTEHFKKDTR